MVDSPAGEAAQTAAEDFQNAFLHFRPSLAGSTPTQFWGRQGQSPHDVYDDSILMATAKVL